MMSDLNQCTRNKTEVNVRFEQNGQAVTQLFKQKPVFATFTAILISCSRHLVSNAGVFESLYSQYEHKDPMDHKDHLFKFTLPGNITYLIINLENWFSRGSK